MALCSSPAEANRKSRIAWAAKPEAETPAWPSLAITRDFTVVVGLITLYGSGSISLGAAVLAMVA